jgi:hypothetical protein
MTKEELDKLPPEVAKILQEGHQVTDTSIMDTPVILDDILKEVDSNKLNYLNINKKINNINTFKTS